MQRHLWLPRDGLTSQFFCGRSCSPIPRHGCDQPPARLDLARVPARCVPSCCPSAPKRFSVVRCSVVSIPSISSLDSIPRSVRPCLAATCSRFSPLLNAWINRSCSSGVQACPMFLGCCARRLARAVLSSRAEQPASSARRTSTCCNTVPTESSVPVNGSAPFTSECRICRAR
jgi:hypothetical protein